MGLNLWYGKEWSKFRPPYSRDACMTFAFYSFCFFFYVLVAPEPLAEVSDWAQQLTGLAAAGLQSVQKEFPGEDTILHVKIIN